jgi:Protein of unknown function (DUF2877)
MPTTLAGRYNRPMALGTVIQIGWRAAEIIADGGPDGRVLAPVGASIYIVVGGEILWLGGPSDLMHPRAVLLSEPPDATAYAAGDALSAPPAPILAWRPAPPMVGARAEAAVCHGARRLREVAASLGTPKGFGAWLIGKPLAFPLAGAAKTADALADACARDDADVAADAALALVGLGAGLTPSGDDLVGGAFFARAALAAIAGSDVAAWRTAASRVRAAAHEATNPISAALLSDLLEGHGWSALHDLVGALACDDDARTVTAARRLTRLGHSSGWDLLTGFIAGAAG